MALPKSNRQPAPKPFPPPKALTNDSRAKENDAVKARGPMPPAAIGTTPPTPHTLHDELGHRLHVLGVCPALVEHFLELGLSREAGLLDDAAQVGPNVLE